MGAAALSCTASKKTIIRNTHKSKSDIKTRCVLHVNTRAREASKINPLQSSQQPSPANSILLAPKHSHWAISAHTVRTGQVPRLTHTQTKLPGPGPMATSHESQAFGRCEASVEAAEPCVCMYVWACEKQGGEAGLLTFQSMVEKKGWRLISSTPSGPAPKDTKHFGSVTLMSRGQTRWFSLTVYPAVVWLDAKKFENL